MSRSDSLIACGGPTGADGDFLAASAPPHAQRHYLCAVRLLELSDAGDGQWRTELLLAAGVHAQLALAGVSAQQGGLSGLTPPVPEDDIRASAVSEFVI